MKKLTRILKNLYLPSCVGLISLSTVGSAQSSNSTYISLDYGSAKMAVQNQDQNITLIKVFGNGSTFPQYPLTLQAPDTTTQFYSLGAGAQLDLSKKFSLRIGPEYDALKNSSEGQIENLKPAFASWQQGYQYQTTSQAFLLNSQLFFAPFKTIDLSIYAGLKLGIAFNTINNFATTAPLATENYYLSYPDQKSNAFALGWDTGLEYQFFKHLALHAGFEQVNFGTATLTQGTWGAPALRNNAPDLQISPLKANIFNAGITILF